MKRHQIIIAVIGICIVLIGLIFFCYHYDLTGFKNRTLWDWLQLLILPLLFGIGGIWFTERLNHDRELAINNQRQTALQEYINKISELLLEQKLLISKKDAEIRTIARAHTLTVLPDLDSLRKQRVIHFLYESGLIKKDTPIISLHEADLRRTDLSQANLRGADLRRADLNQANLCEADLRWADLSQADLREADLCWADLRGSILHWANLSRTNLSQANLSGVDLSQVDLYGADLREANLENTSLKSIYYDDNTKWPKDFKKPARYEG